MLWMKRFISDGIAELFVTASNNGRISTQVLKDQVSAPRSGDCVGYVHEFEALTWDMTFATNLLLSRLLILQPAGAILFESEYIWG